MKRVEFIHHRLCLDEKRVSESDKKHWMENWEILGYKVRGFLFINISSSSLLGEDRRVVVWME